MLYLVCIDFQPWWMSQEFDGHALGCRETLPEPAEYNTTNQRGDNDDFRG